MTIVNDTNVDILVSSEILKNSNIVKPKCERFYNGRNFYGINIHSDIGSCEIKVFYREITIRRFGKIVAKLSEEKDKNGFNKIIITANK